MTDTSQQVKSVAAILFVLYLTTAADDFENVDYIEHFMNSCDLESSPLMRLPRAGDASFGYEKDDGPLTWGEKFPACRGKKQSPIDIISSSSHTQHNEAIQWRGYKNKPIKMTIINNGNTVVVHGKWDKECNTPRVRVRNHKEEFVFQELHFHWGENDTVGSEHTINGDRYPLEMHMVHYRKDLGSVAKAAEKSGGLMVLGILFKLCSRESTEIGQLVQYFSKVSQDESSVNIKPVALAYIVPIFSKHYFTYEGSLTTPPCFESVQWVVSKRPASVTSEELRKFRHFTDHGKLIKRNYRPTQPLNGRVVEEIK